MSPAPPPELRVLALADPRRAAAELRAGFGWRIALAPAGVAAEALPERAFVARSPLELWTLARDLPASEPLRVVVAAPDGSLDAPARAELQRVAEAGLDARAAQRESAVSFGPLWARQAIANLPELARHPSIAALRDAFAGRACVLVSPGPSLERALPLLALLDGRAIVLASTHAVSALVAAGAPPDLVLATDPQDLLPHLAPVDPTGVGVLALALTCDPRLFRLGASRCVTLAANGRLDDWIADALCADARLASGGSVACAGLSLALWMGCEPIALVGQDLCFPGGRYYARESLDGSARVIVADDGKSFELERYRPLRAGLEQASHRTRAEALVLVRGWRGEPLPSSASLARFLGWFEAAASSARAGRIVNCSEGGARIRGLAHAPLGVLVERLRERFDPRARLDALLVRASADAGPRLARARTYARELAGALATLARGGAGDERARAAAVLVARERGSAALAAAAEELARTLADARAALGDD